jgi:hypothetical protein
MSSGDWDEAVDVVVEAFRYLEDRGYHVFREPHMNQVTVSHPDIEMLMDPAVARLFSRNLTLQGRVMLNAAYDRHKEM